MGSGAVVARSLCIFRVRLRGFHAAATSTAPALYTLPARQRDPLGAVFSSFGVAIWLGALTCWMATQSVASGFGYQSALGHPLIRHLYSPFAVFIWALAFDRLGASAATHAVFVHAYVLLATGSVITVFATTLLAVRRVGRAQRHSDLYGSAHWASPKEVDATGLLARRHGVYVGAWRDPRSGDTRYLRDAGSTHCLALVHANGVGEDRRPRHPNAPVLGTISSCP